MVDPERLSIAVLPARAGMIPASPSSAFLPTGAPRTSGDDPAVPEIQTEKLMCSPHERG